MEANVQTEVVTCFLRDPRRGEVLLLRRPEEAPTYGGSWGGVSGYIECEDTDEDAYREIREETGIEVSSLELVRRGEPFVVDDDALGEGFVVHPYLFDTSARDVSLNRESDLAEWCPPTEILRRDTVPDLWKSYASVAPTVETVAEDEEHGSAYVSERALEVLRDTAGVAGEDAVRRTARRLVEARPSMAVVGNRVARAFDVGSGGAEGVKWSAHEGVGRAQTADRRASEEVAEMLGDSVVTLSRSGTVAGALEVASPSRITVAESLPGGEGTEFADGLAERTGASVSVFPDSCVSEAVRDADTALVGADTVLADGGVVNKVGSASLALASEYHGVPFYAVSSADKIAPSGFELDSETVTYHGEEVRVFETVSSELVTIVAEEGVLPEERTEEICREHERMRDEIY